MRAVDLIRKKRDSGELSREEINFLVSGYTRGEIPDYQMAAWLMAVWIRGMNRDRKSTRLNSSHSQISYAVFCLKKKKRLPDHARDIANCNSFRRPQLCNHSQIINSSCASTA